MSSSSTATASTQSGRALVSIVIPNYNYGQYLRFAIDSALAQTYSPVEVIVVDDGSTDDSREVIESYGERIGPIIKANGGHGSALNAGYADPYNPVDAIFAAARYLHAAGASTDLRTAILAYNHSDAYVESVLLRARLFASYPPSVIATLTGLTEGSLPVAGAQLSPLSEIPQGALAPSPAGASSATAGTVGTEPGTQAQATPTTRKARAAAPPGSTPAPSPAASAARAERALNAPAPPSQLSELLGRRNAPVVAVEDGRVVGIGVSRKLGRYLVLRDTYGDLFTYAGFGSLAPRYRLPKPVQVQVPKGALQSGETGSDPTPKQAATAGRQLPVTLHVAKKKAAAQSKLEQPRSLAAAAADAQVPVGTGKVRVFAHPGNPDAITAARLRERTRLKAHDGRRVCASRFVPPARRVRSTRDRSSPTGASSTLPFIRRGPKRAPCLPAPPLATRSCSHVLNSSAPCSPIQASSSAIATVGRWRQAK